jgi:hypothetical protein
MCQFVCTCIVCIVCALRVTASSSVCIRALGYVAFVPVAVPVSIAVSVLGSVLVPVQAPCLHKHMCWCYVCGCVCFHAVSVLAPVRLFHVSAAAWCAAARPEPSTCDVQRGHTKGCQGSTAAPKTGEATLWLLRWPHWQLMLIYANHAAAASTSGSVMSCSLGFRPKTPFSYVCLGAGVRRPGECIPRPPRAGLPAGVQPEPPAVEEAGTSSTISR